MKKKAFLTIPAVLALLGLASCALPVSTEEGNLRVRLSGAGDGRALSEATQKTLSYTVEFRGPGGETITENPEQGANAVTVSVIPGTWTVRVKAYLANGTLYGAGETSVTVEGNKTNEALVTMALASWHVAQGGSDEDGDGSQDSPFATVAKALEAVKAAYAAEWPGKGAETETPTPATILVSGVITADQGSPEGMIEIIDEVLYTAYPPIILRGIDDGENAVNALNKNRRLVLIFGADLTLGEGLALIKGRTLLPGAGVYVGGGGKFTMEGGSIRDNTSSGALLSEGGGGVHVASIGTFTMKGGTISENTTLTVGGGVYVESGGIFTMEDGTIHGNISAHGGGGVYLEDNGIEFIMYGGTISGNTASMGSGGGVYVGFDSEFTMSGGTISENVSPSNGGVGVYLCGAGSIFTMSGGTISGHTCFSPSYGGGGVYVGTGSEFIMSGGTISENTTLFSGGGVYVVNGGGFVMEGGTISGNKSLGTSLNSGGGGVYVEAAPVFFMSGGTISGNTASGNGGGVWADEFHMNGGAIISGNTASGSGGGVYAGTTFDMMNGTISGNTSLSTISGSGGGGVYVPYAGGSLSKTGGIIYGINEELSRRNTAHSTGHAVYMNPAHLRNSTAGQLVILDSATGGTSGGWE